MGLASSGVERRGQLGAMITSGVPLGLCLHCVMRPCLLLLCHHFPCLLNTSCGGSRSKDPKTPPPPRSCYNGGPAPGRNSELDGNWESSKKMIVGPE